jgi:hypothetical protein
MAAHDILIIEYPFIGIDTYIHTYAPIHIKFYLCEDNGGIHTKPSIHYFRNEDCKRLCEVIY